MFLTQKQVEEFCKEKKITDYSIRLKIESAKAAAVNIHFILDHENDLKRFEGAMIKFESFYCSPYDDTIEIRYSPTINKFGEQKYSDEEIQDLVYIISKHLDVGLIQKVTIDGEYWNTTPYETYDGCIVVYQFHVSKEIPEGYKKVTHFNDFKSYNQTYESIECALKS